MVADTLHFPYADGGQMDDSTREKHGQRRAPAAGIPRSPRGAPDLPPESLDRTLGLEGMPRRGPAISGRRPEVDHRR